MNQFEPNKNIGRLLLDAGKLKLNDIELIEHCQREQGLLFGEAAVKLGLVAEADILQIAACDRDPLSAEGLEDRIGDVLTP